MFRLNSVLVPLVNMQAPPNNGTLIANTRAARTAMVESDTYSAFAQLSYHLTDQLSMTLGGRVTHETKNGGRSLTIQQLNGSPLAGIQAIAAPLVYANIFRISSSNLTTIAGMPISPGSHGQCAARSAWDAPGGRQAVDDRIRAIGQAPV